MLAIREDVAEGVEVKIGSAEMAEALKRGDLLYRRVYDIYLCPPDDKRDCDDGSPVECGHCKNGVCTRDYYI